MLSFLPKNPKDIREELRAKFKARRKSLKYTQDELATRSGVSLGSLKRFESSGQISLESLLKLAFVLECLGDFEEVCKPKEVMPESIEDLL
ncbi:MAG: Transcriptional regulator [uncultured Sulfurovum sp.]|uniref:Transcriptional regulator n=1 Tax=uncultured Sulfurovum sp. TaxID=269237 RepID=A0A6S6TAL6_9BACT|nr:MAG: Transcriptional regulator [uncultured Sulfurovum sp.]